MPKPILIDADLRNADWSKRSWDLPYTDVASLRVYLRGVGVSVERFKLLPAYTLALPANPWLKDL